MNAISRRRFLQASGALVLGQALSASRASGADAQGVYYVSAQGAEAEPDAGLLLMHAESGAWSKLRAPFRGHAVAVNPARPARVLMFPRRPGFQALEFDLRAGRPSGGYRLDSDRQAYGHGQYSADGRLLFCCEGVISTGQGLVVVRDARTFAVLAEWDSGGIGPHELKRLPDGHTLAVANGGLLTRPTSARRVLNLDSMRSNLSYLDAGSGRLVETVEGAHPRASIRHLDVADDGTVALAMQYQRLPADAAEPVPLAARHRRGGRIEMLRAPTAAETALRDYLGGVRIHRASGRAAFTSPRGHVALFWDLAGGEFLGYEPLHDVCGVTVDAGGKAFVLSNSLGELRFIDSESLREDRARRRVDRSLRWDNHMTSVYLG